MNDSLHLGTMRVKRTKISSLYIVLLSYFQVSLATFMFYILDTFTAFFILMQQIIVTKQSWFPLMG